MFTPTPPSTLLAIARQYWDAGFCPLPRIQASPEPAYLSSSGEPHSIAWGEYKTKQPDWAVVQQWFSHQPDAIQGIALLAGSSAHPRANTTAFLQILDLETAEAYDAWREELLFLGHEATLYLCVIERTPSGGAHVGFLCRTIGDTQKVTLARRARDKKLLIELLQHQPCTVAPTAMAWKPEHPDGAAYRLTQGSWEHLHELSGEQRLALVDCARSLNEVPAEVVDRSLKTPSGTRPGDLLNAQADAPWWQEFLVRHDWRDVSRAGKRSQGVFYFQRPGKTGFAPSASFGMTGASLYVFSSNAQPFEADKAYSAFSAFALLEHGGNFQAAARALPPPPRSQPYVPGLNGTHADAPAIATMGDGIDWHALLLTTQGGEPKENIPNILCILRYHPDWQGKLWWDEVRSLAMVGEEQLSDRLVATAASWLGTHEHMPVRSFDMLQRCLVAQCQEHTRDLLQEWLGALPPWDGVERLDTWLDDVAGVGRSVYAMDISRLLPLSMVARALDPGCIYRYVVVLEGPEELGKSTLVRELAGEGWAADLSLTLDNKEAHMMLQGVWVAEFSELNALNRTEDTRMKGFVTMREDSYIPKYSNNRVRVKRRTVFIGTTNASADYLKGDKNTRYLPIRCAQAIDLPLFRSVRTQLFSEALRTYQAHPDDWWRLRDDAIAEAIEQRDARRVVNVYETPLQDWLEKRPEPRASTSWAEIASQFLGMATPEHWKDRALQMQIASALVALGWTSVVRRQGAKTSRVWEAPKVVTTVTTP